MAEKILFFYLFIFWSTVVPFGLILGMVMSNHKGNTINFTFWWFDPPFGQKWPKMAKKVFFSFFLFFSFFFCSIIVLFQLISFMVMRNHVKNTINFKFWWFDPPKGSKRAKKGQKIGKICENQGFWPFDQNWLTCFTWKSL